MVKAATEAAEGPNISISGPVLRESGANNALKLSWSVPKTNGGTGDAILKQIRYR